jgi:hypothetical protein
VYILTKYHHVLAWAFRTNIRKSEVTNFLKPKSRFYHLLNLSAFCIIWFTSVFFTACLEGTSDTIDEIGFGAVLGISIACAIVASPIVIGCTYMIEELYVKNIRKAFLNARDPPPVLN